MSNLESGKLEIGRFQLHHTFGGGGEPAIVFIHGLGSSGYIEWRHNLPHFAARHRVGAPDLPGFGKSAKPPRVRYGIPLFARAIDRYMEAVGLESAVIVGTSMGGRVAIEVALRYPRRVASLVLVDPLGLGRPSLQPYYPLMMVPRLGEALLHGARHGLRLAPPPLIRNLAGRFIGISGDVKATMNDEYLDDMREMYGSLGYPRAYVRTVRSLASVRQFISNTVDVTARVAELSMPLLLIWGENDPLFPVAQATRAHARLPGSRLVIIAGAGHTPQAERPDEFNRALAEFIAG